MKKSPNSKRAGGARTPAHITTAGPARPPAAAPADAPAQHAADQESLADAVPFNPLKAADHGAASARAPSAGQQHQAPRPASTAGTLSETQANAKTGDATAPGAAAPASLDRFRVDSGGHALTTDQGVPISDNQNSLKAGLRGPTLLEDFILREKITHFDHERIPERVVHARGSGAHGHFEAYEALDDITRAAPFAAAGKITPVFVRFSTVAGERGSMDTARDVRGFAVKFYTEDGNWDLVGNNMPVFFIQDAMKFPDLIHAVKPEPNNAIPQAASAHDTFWDFVSLSPESTHMLMWVMSDRALPRSYRMMQGFGVHTFRLVNADGTSVFCKFHWKPLLGTHSLVWDEAVKIGGADPDFHRRDLWEAIEAGNLPEWELGLQLFTEEQAGRFSFDVLDATKLVPEELVPVRPVGRMVLNRNPDNFFAETEQVAFCTSHVIPGIDFSNDPLLQGRNHSYLDTQISRLGGANFHEIPINAPLAGVYNNQRDGSHRRAIARGRVAYEPNSLAGGCPFQAGMRGFVSFPARLADGGAVDMLRGKPEKFAEHYNQATLFYESQTEVEKEHIAGGFRFELSKVTVPAIRRRMLSSLLNVSARLAAEVAEGLGIEVPPAMPRAIERVPEPEVTRSAALSLTALSGPGGIQGRKIAVLAADGVETASLAAVQEELSAAGGVPRVVGIRLGSIRGAGAGNGSFAGNGAGTGGGRNGNGGGAGAAAETAAARDNGAPLEADATLENSPAVLFDAVVLPDGEHGVQALAADGQAIEFIRDQYRHGKTILALGAASGLLDKAGIGDSPVPGRAADPGLILTSAASAAAAVQSFIAAVGKHRHPQRDRDPPPV